MGSSCGKLNPREKAVLAIELSIHNCNLQAGTSDSSYPHPSAIAETLSCTQIVEEDNWGSNLKSKA